MKRREFITFFAGAAVPWPSVLHAQLAERTRRLGVLMTQSAGDPEVQARLNAFRQGLEAFGWIEGRNIRTEFRFAEGQAEKALAYATELAGQEPDVILANGRAILAAFRDRTRTVPIVFVLVPDPVGDGFVQSLAKPAAT